MRLIDADALMETINRHCYPVRQENNSIETGMTRIGIIQAIQEQPTVEPEPHWIPCSERLPEESGLYIVTNGGRWIEPVGTRYYNIRADGGFWSGHPGDKVLAWMPLPEPYREEHDERE